MFTSSSDLMGPFVNSRLTRVVAIAGCAVVLVLNVFLIVQTFGVPIPGLVP
jgi:manganese transport protein